MKIKIISAILIFVCCVCMLIIRIGVTYYIICDILWYLMHVFFWIYADKTKSIKKRNMVNVN